MLFSAAGLAALALMQAPAAPLDFEAARALARERYPAILAARFQSSAAHRQADAAGVWADPVVGVQLWNMPLNHIEGALHPGMTPSQRAVTLAKGPDMIPIMVMAQQTFPWPGKRGAAQREARAVAHQQEAQVQLLIADVDRAVAYAFAESVAASRSMETLSSTAGVLDTTVAISDARVSINAGSPLDALTARTERELLTRDMIDVQQQQSIARGRLASLLGFPDVAQLGLLRQSVTLAKLPPRDQLIRAAISQRAEFKSARAAVDAALARAERTRLAIIPDVTANVSYMANFGGVDSAVMGGPAGALLGPADQVTVGVSFPLPVFALWGQTREADAARLEHRRAEASVDALVTAVTSEIDGLLAGEAHARAHLELHEKTLIPLSVRTVDMAQASYESGTGQLLAVVGAVRTLRSHHLDRWAAQAEYARHMADLERATGLPLIHFVDDAETVMP